MQDPQDLVRFEADATELDPRPGVLIVAMGAFIDAGHTQRLFADHLLAVSDAVVLASFDIDQLYDYRARRPMMVFDTNRWLSYDDPSLVLYRLVDRDGTAYYLLSGPEPDYQWERLVEAIHGIIDHFGVTLTVSVHGIPMAVPHTRPIGMTAHATDPSLIADAESPFGTVSVPGSFASLLELRLGEVGRDALGFAIHVPHYLAQSDFPDGALTALNAVVDVTGLNLANDDLAAAAGLNRAEIAREVDGNDEVIAVVRALERQYDAFLEGKVRPGLLATEASEIPSADELGAEFEEFLKQVSDESPDA